MKTTKSLQKVSTKFYCGYMILVVDLAVCNKDIYFLHDSLYKLYLYILFLQLLLTKKKSFYLDIKSILIQFTKKD